MTQEALKLALDWAEAHGEIVFAGGGMSAVNKMNSWVAAIKEALAQEKALQALHSENERLGLYKDAYAQRTWVDLTRTQMQDVYFAVLEEHRGGHQMEGQLAFGEALQAKLKERNT